MEYMPMILSWCMIGLICFRIFWFRPHKLANVLTTIFLTMIVLMQVDGVGEESALGGIVCGCAFITWILHILAKKYDKKREAKKAAKDASQKSMTSASQPKIGYVPSGNAAQKPAPKTKSEPKPVIVPQTLTTCVRCARPLYGPKCRNCNFDHTAQPILFLCQVEPHKLQIQMHEENATEQKA